VFLIKLLNAFKPSHLVSYADSSVRSIKLKYFILIPQTFFLIPEIIM